MKSKSGSAKVGARLLRKTTGYETLENTSVNELADEYSKARGAPAARMSALRGVLRGHMDACAALVDGIPVEKRRAKVNRYLKRLYELRSHSLPPGDWHLDVLEWLRNRTESQ